MEKPLRFTLKDFYLLPVVPAPLDVDRVCRVVLTQHHVKAQAEKIEEERDRVALSR